jgi:very-short-patch-repair endonuclease
MMFRNGSRITERRYALFGFRDDAFRVLRFWNDHVLRELGALYDTIIADVRDVNLKPWR